ncbi:MAG TPA: hypothetical protein VL995_19510 [Cellvibrio sp.]|nr:hypothetical protein [Cellvibrio sp.]
MAEIVSFGQRLKISVLAIALFVLGIGFLLGALTLVSWSFWLFLAVIITIAFVALPIAWLVKKLLTRFSVHSTIPRFRSIWLTLVLLITAVVTFPYFYLAVKSETTPLVLPQAVLSDGNKTVIFQGMVHVGSENFYKSVVYDLEEALDEGYKLYYEGIMPSSPDADKWFSDTIAGGASLSDNYRQLADVCGVKFQLDYFKLLIHDIQARPERHATVDVTTADLKKEYERLLTENPAFAAAIAEEGDNKSEKKGLSDDAAKKIFSFVQHANDNQKNIIGTLCRGFFVYALKVTPDKKPQTLDPLLLDFRNKHLAQQIQADSNPKIYITYGAGHLPGLIQLLREGNPAWEIKSLKWIRGMAAPEHLEGQL